MALRWVVAVVWDLYIPVVVVVVVISLVVVPILHQFIYVLETQAALQETYQNGYLLKRLAVNGLLH